MLLRLTDDEAGAESRDGALQQKFSDVATLLAALDPPLARVMFSKLARAVLDLGPERRTDLLRRTILPALLDGRADGAVLRDFPNVDLAESLCLLMDLETAAPELLTTALDRLDLPAERRQAVAPLMEARLRGGDAAAARAPAHASRTSTVTSSRLIRVNPSAGKSFADFAAFDLSIDDQTTGGARPDSGVDRAHRHAGRAAGVPAESGPPGAESGARRRLSPPQPDGARRARARGAVSRTSRRGRAQYGRLADALRQSRPDVADAIANALAAFCTPDRAMALLDLYADRCRRAGSRERARRSVRRRDGAGVRGPARRSGHAHQDARARAADVRTRPAARAARSPCGSAPRGVGAVRAIIKVLGFAGPGYEDALAEQLQDGDEQTAREALQALAHIGSTRAAGIVGVHLRQGASSVRAAAEEALRHFPPAAAAAALRDLLGEPRVHRAASGDRRRGCSIAPNRSGLTDLQPAMRALAPLRFRFWNPALVRVALKARTMIGPR